MEEKMKVRNKKILSVLLKIYLGLMIFGTVMYIIMAIIMKNIAIMLVLGSTSIFTGILSFIALLLLGNFENINIFKSKNKKEKKRIAWISTIVIFLFMEIIMIYSVKLEANKSIESASSNEVLFEDKSKEEKVKQEELAKQEEEKKKQEELAKQEEEKKKQEELAKQEEENKRQESTINDSEFKSAIGNLYTGVTLYAEENGQMEPYFTVLDIGENVSNPGSEVIKKGVLVKEIHSGDIYWKDINRMIKDSMSNEEYIIKYYVKSNDPYLPK